MMFLVDPCPWDDCCKAGDGDVCLPQPLAHEGRFLVTAGGSSGEPEEGSNSLGALTTTEAVEVEEMDGGISLLLVFSV